MMWPQIILTVYLGWLCLMNVVTHTAKTVDQSEDLAYLVGGLGGIVLRYATIFACLYFGGFYRGVAQ